METLEPFAPRRRPPLRGAMIVLLSLVTVFGLVFAAVTFAQKRDAAGAKPPAPAISNADLSLARTVTAVAETAPGETQALSGVLEARHVVTVSAEVAARIVSRPIERGDRVAKGEMVAVFDDRTARATVAEAEAALLAATASRKGAEADYERAQTETASAVAGATAAVRGAAAGEKKARSATRTQELRQAEAALSQTETDENLAKIERDRYAKLVSEGAIAQQVLDRTQAAYDSALARTRSAREAVSLAREGARSEDIAQAAANAVGARANLQAAQARPARLAAIREQIAALRASEQRATANVQNARVQLSKHRIASPLTGRVLETRAETGEIAAPGAAIAVLSDVRDLRAVFAVPEAARPLLSVGKRVSLTTDALPGKTFPARVAVLNFQGDARTRTFRVEVAVSNVAEALLPNMTARLSLPVGTAMRRVTVPVSAVATDPVSGETFVLAVRETGSTRQRVTLGEPIGTNAVRVVKGLNGGETLVANPDR